MTVHAYAPLSAGARVVYFFGVMDFCSFLMQTIDFLSVLDTNYFNLESSDFSDCSADDYATSPANNS